MKKKLLRVQKSSRKWIFLLLFLLLRTVTFAQQPVPLITNKDSLVIQADSLSKDLVVVKQHNPKLATTMSAILPGLGQAYNKKYWKIPVIYAGIGTFAYLFRYNQYYFRSYKNAYILRTDQSAETIDAYDGMYSAPNLLTLMEVYRRNRDLSVIGIAAFYLLNIIDASVDAHLYSFDVSDDLSLKIYPDVRLNSFNTFSTGVSLNLKF